MTPSGGFAQKRPFGSKRGRSSFLTTETPKDALGKELRPLSHPPIHLQQIVSTIYTNLGIDPNSTTVTDPTGRPRYFVDVREPIHELV
jgi:hypothetical protein